jgi:hypothetical protein
MGDIWRSVEQDMIEQQALYSNDENCIVVSAYIVVNV